MEGHHRVHFDSEDLEGGDHFGKDNTIVVQAGPKKHEVTAHLGFLQYNHHYQVTFSVPSNVLIQTLSKDNESVTEEYLHSQIMGLMQEVPNVHCHLMEASATTGLSNANGESNDSSEVTFKIQLLAHKVKLMREKIQLKYPCGLSLALLIHARVLGKGMGTPMLKNGIKCVGSEPDESDASDWTGFQ
ncbi:adipose-secreted signaling protein [Hetaerina americana]|uniref:adipose-secreted signaling protein n=1 Tax=Hetaerina americana TaxID=62018 RepID=UPI003A7F4075